MQVGPLLLALLLALSCVALADHHDDHDHDDDHDDHLAEFSAIDHRLDVVTARIERLKHKIGRRTDPGMISKARSLRARVQKIEGTYW